MNAGAVATAAAVRDVQGVDRGCFHCSEALPAVPATARIDGAPRRFCCDGCAAAAQWIRDAHLVDYYRLRSEPGGRVADLDAQLAAFDRDDIQSGHVRDVDGGREITVLTDGMRCAACAWLVDRALAREPGVLEVVANAVTGRIRIAWDPARTALSAPLRRLASLGYAPYLASGDARERERRAQRNRDLLRIGVAGLVSIQAMMFAEALYLDVYRQMPLATRDFFRWVTLLMSTPVVFWCGWPFIAGMLRELRNRHLGMDTLIASSTLLAYFASVFETLRGGAHVWYDAAVMFVFLLLGARMLEQRARRIAVAQVDTLARARPALATRELADGSREVVPTAALAPGDIACIAAGDAVPADGILLDEAARFEEALLTGESHPVRHLPGDTIYAGTVCREAPARIRIEQVGAGTRLSQLESLVERAQSHRPKVAQLADAVSSRFVAGILLAAALVFIGWRIHDPSRALEVTIALLVISCPCALSLAVPTSLAVAHGALAKLGVLSTDADALGALATATDIVFDKTGTLGSGAPSLSGAKAFGGFEIEDALEIAAAMERDSLHPIARAFAGHDGGLAVDAVEEHPGLGIAARVDGRSWRLGRADFASGGDDDGALWLGDGHDAVARFVLEEPPRADAAAAVAALRGLGVAVHLSSGDAAVPVAAFAHRIGIEGAASRQSPEDKLRGVRDLQADGRVVAMVGDGLNDAPVLAGADVSIAIGSGAALAHRAAGLVLTAPSLLRIPAAVRLARRTRAIVRQNLAWALGYNLVAIPLAAAGLVTPWVAALGMALSSLIVTVNALRLARAGAA
ncbi:heavy metal translocating P-type ATPase [Luteimonas arsenica]|uniref:heavy metal translocating P-type ATPase n=1 Tax=Luteimonas arsenica TaxID=1586242 RepID=UPI001FB83582|nr:heavy metal translocating P-type ATPase [Luteimonas arsenica]